MSRHPVEALLRPPVELWSSVVALATAGIAVLAPWALMMPPGVAYAAAAALALLGIVRWRQAWRVLRYQRNLRRLPTYRLRADQVPVSRRKLFLGRGFRWTQKHTQRLRDTLRPEVQQYVQPGPLYGWARRKEVAWEATPLLKWVAAGLRSRAWWNPLRPLPPLGGKPALHAVEPEEQDVWMDIGERVGHTLVLGTTRVGKTRLAEILITQDIRRGDVVIVFDPKGDADLLRRVYAEAKRAGRAKDFYLFHLGYPQVSARYNAIGSFSRITEVATRIANQLPSEGNSAAFKEFAWRFVNIIARALVALGRRPDYQQVRRYINDIEPLFVEYAREHLRQNGEEGWEAAVAEVAANTKERNLPSALRGRHPDAVALMRYLQAQDLYDPVLDGLVSAFKYDKTYFDKIVSSVGPLMEKLTTGKIAELISPNYLDADDNRPIFEWLEVIRRKGIVYVGLDALTDTTVASAVGNSMFADLVSVAGHIYKHGVQDTADGPSSAILTEGAAAMPTISLHADEFNELIGDEFVPLLNKAGGAGFQVTAYTQTWSDVEARIGNRAKAGQVAGNFNTLVMLRVKELATAEMLTEQLPRVEVFTLMSVSGVDDSSDPTSGVDFKSRNEDRISVSEVPMLTPAELVALPKGQAFALLEGGNLWKLRMPLPDASKDPVMPESLAAVANEMERTYITNDHWYRQRETWWHVVADTPQLAQPQPPHRKAPMAEAVSDPRRREVRQGLISTTLTTLAQGVQWLLLALLFSILTEWAGMVFWWPEEGLQHSRSMLEAEIGYLDADFRRSAITSSPAELATAVADKTYYVLFEFTGLVDFMAWVSASPAPEEQGFRPWLHSLYRPIAEFVIAAMQVTQVFSVRLAILTLAVPVFVLFSLVALVDGFVKRDLRRWGGGRESSFVYHWAKRSAIPLLVLSWVIYLALPFSLHPTFIVLPFATLFALSVAVTAGTFKKYL